MITYDVSNRTLTINSGGSEFCCDFYCGNSDMHPVAITLLEYAADRADLQRAFNDIMLHITEQLSELNKHARDEYIRGLEDGRDGK